MKNITRYDFFPYLFESGVDKRTREDGDYVTFEDHEAAVAELKAEILYTEKVWHRGMQTLEKQIEADEAKWLKVTKLLEDKNSALEAKLQSAIGALKSAQGFVEAHDHVGFAKVKVRETLAKLTKNEKESEGSGNHE